MTTSPNTDLTSYGPVEGGSTRLSFLPPALAGVVGVLGLVIATITTAIQVMSTDFPIDMVIYREGVKAFMAGGEVYSVPMMAGDIALPFIYPPFGALVMVPLAGDWFSHAMAGDIMIVLSNLLIGLVVLLLAFALNRQRSNPFVSSDVIAAASLIWGIVLIFEPVRLNNGFAQINIIIMVLVALDLIPRKRLKWLPQGWLIGVAAAIKITPLAMLLYFLVRKEIKPIITAAISAIIATLIAAAVRWDVAWEYFSIKLLSMSTGGDFGVQTAYQSNSSIKGAIERLYTSQEGMETASTITNIIWLCLAIITVILGGWLMVALMKRGLNIEAWMINAFIMLIISPVSWSHHWVWVAIAIPVLLYRAITWRHLNWAAGILISILSLWAILVVTVPPKWYWADGINVWDMELVFKLVINDFVWLSVSTMLALAYMLRFVPAKAPAAR
ncbi:MAG: glycosyltransferase family 87 protein [Corynebacterium casei]|uniref:glycosyltransferase family 87 protein n=1 Tax=Corynebacterium casei TaxID=160386 RepID=UPI000BF04FF7|nr:glycosyltransferase family 87 protein [Corynebacterium casei]